MRKTLTSWNIFWMGCILVASAYLLLLHVYNNKTYTNEQIDKMFEPVTSKYGIRIVYKVGDDFFSDLVGPIIPAGPDRRSKVTPIRQRVLALYPEILHKALEKYPVEVIKTYLKAIHFAGEIDQAGFKYGGSYDPFRHVIYMVDNGRQTENDSISNFHHEFSSLLIKSHSFFLNPWIDQNPKSFEYLGDIYDNWEALKKDVEITRKGRNQDYEKGFMNTYGQTNFGNDFSEYSGMILTNPEKFKKIMNRHPRVRGKFQVWLEYYHQIDPIFTEAYLLGKD